MLPFIFLTIEDPDRRAEYESAYYRYRQHMFVLANLILKDEALAEDAVQNAFLSIIQSDSLPYPAEEEKLKAYLSVVVKRKAIDLLRVEGHISKEELTDSQLGIEPDSQASDVAEAIKPLPVKYKDLLISYYYIGLSAKEIARQQGLGYRVVLRQLRYAEELFRTEYLKDR